MSSMRWTVALLVTLRFFTGTTFAHDFGSGPRMGLPPNQSEVEQRLLRLVPAGLDQSTQDGIKGVIDRAKMWPQYEELIACFLSGTRKARARVAAIAVEWTNYVNLRLNFGDMSDPRKCSGGVSEHIKIDFRKTGPNAGHWSNVGEDSWQYSQSMNLDGFGEDALPVSEAEYRGVVLHEFGHALGFAHEHQSPAAKCDAEFDAKRVEAWAGRMGWSATDVKTNLSRLLPSTSLEFTRHDTKSIMHYSLPEGLFVDGKNNRCWVPKNNELSEGDKMFAASIYPPRVASSDNSSSQSVRLGLPSPEIGPEVEASYRAELQTSFARLLAKSSKEPSEVEELVASFRAELANFRNGPVGKK